MAHRTKQPPANGAVAVFVKTPPDSPVKTRLARHLGQSAAEDFYWLSVRAVAASVQSACRASGWIPFWAVAEAGSTEHPAWKEFDLITQGEGGLGHRLHHVFASLQRQCGRVLLLGADAPQLSEALLSQAMHELANGPADYCIGRALDGGFYLFGGRRPLPESTWTRVEYSRSDTADCLIAALKPAACRETGVRLTDVDVVDDLPVLLRELSLLPFRSAPQQAIVEWLERRTAMS